MKSYHHLKTKWLAKETKIQETSSGQKKKKRNYLHFDRYVDPLKAWKYVSDPQNVSTRSFYPLIQNTLNERKLSSHGFPNLEIKTRTIYYAAHSDALIYSWYSTVIDEIYEKNLEESLFGDCVLAYRSGKGSNAHFAKEVFDEIKKREEIAIVCLDITSFFDSLLHTHLLKMWKKLLNKDSLPEDHWSLFKRLTQFHYIEKKKLFNKLGIKKNEKFKKKLCEPSEFRALKELVKKNTKNFGIAQGTPISDHLSNIYMMEFDKMIFNQLKKIGGFYRRYSDDIIILCPIGEIDEIQKTVTQLLETIGLSINKKKTDVFLKKKALDNLINNKSKTKKLQYLGFTFDGKKIEVRPSTLARHYRRLKRSVKRTEYKAKKNNSNFLKQKKLTNQYTSLGKTNFISYVQRSAAITNSQPIIQQLRNNNRIFKKAIKSATARLQQ